MKKYHVYAVYCGCGFADVYVDTPEEAREAEERIIRMNKDMFGEENYDSGNGDFCTYIEICDV